MKRLFVVSLLLAGCLASGAQTKTDITKFNLSGPYTVIVPMAFDSVDVQGKKFDDKSLLKTISLTSPTTNTFEGTILPSLENSRSVGLLTFFVNNSDYIKGKITVKGPKNYQLYIDGVEAGEELKLAPEHHIFEVLG